MATLLILQNVAHNRSAITFSLHSSFYCTGAQGHRQKNSRVGGATKNSTNKPLPGEGANGEKNEK